MKATLEMLAFTLLAVPVAITLLWAAPGLGILLAIVLATIVFYIHTQKLNAIGATHAAPFLVNNQRAGGTDKSAGVRGKKDAEDHKHAA